MINNLQSILTQSSLSTEAPIFVVYSKQPVVVDGDFDYDKIIYVKSEDDYPELTFSEYEELEEEYNLATDYRSISIDSSGEQVIYEIPKDPCSGDDFDPDDWEKRYVKFVDKFEQAFFVRKNAEDFIERQSHHLSQPYIFVESAWRNPEWQQIREFLISEAKKKENTFGELKFGLKYEDIVDGMVVVYSELPISNYANSLKRIWKTDDGWKEETLAVEWENKYESCGNELWTCHYAHIWDEKCYAPVDYDVKTPPVDFMNKVLPLTIKGPQDT